MVMQSYYPKNRTKLIVKDSSLYFPPRGINPNERYQWDRYNLYCYDYRVSLASKKNVYDFMKAEIEDYFNVDSYFEEIEKDCYVLTMTDSLKLKTSGGQVISDEGKELWRLQNYRMKTVVGNINDQDSSTCGR